MEIRLLSDTADHTVVVEVFDRRYDQIFEAGVPAAAIIRAYHLHQVPLLSQRLRVLADGTIAKFCRRDIAELGMSELPGPDGSTLVGIPGERFGTGEREHATDHEGDQQQHAGQDRERLLERK